MQVATVKVMHLSLVNSACWTSFYSELQKDSVGSMLRAQRGQNDSETQSNVFLVLKRQR